MVKPFEPGSFDKGAPKRRRQMNRKIRSAAIKKGNKTRRATDPDKLLPKERMFCLIYTGTANFCGADAAREAGYSEKSAKSIAAQLLAKPHIIRAISDILETRSKDLRITNRTVLYEAWQCYALAREKGDLSNARNFLEMIGKHVDVSAFRTQLGIGGPDGGAVEFNLNGLSTDEKLLLLNLLERAGALEPGEAESGPPRLNS